MKKRLSLLMVLMMVLSLVPMSVFAAAGSMPGGRVEANDNETVVKEVTVKLTQAAYTNLKAGSTRLTLNKGEFAVEADAADYAVGTYVKGNTEFEKAQRAAFNVGKESILYNNAATTTAVAYTSYAVNDSKVVSANEGYNVDSNLSVKLDKAFANVAYVNFPDIQVGAKDMDIILTLYVLFDEEDAGDVTLAVEEVGNSGLKVADPIKVAVVKEGKSKDLQMVVTDATKKIGMQGGELSKIEIKEFKNSGANEIVLELPDYMTWMNNIDTDAIAGNDKIVVSIDGNDYYAGAVDGVVSVSGEKLTLKNSVLGATSILIKPVVNVTKRDASIGDITLKVTSYKAGSKIESINEVIGVIADYDVAMTAVEKSKKEIPSLFGGEKAKVRVKLSGVVGSFTSNRDIDFTVDGAQIVTGSIQNVSNFQIGSALTNYKVDSLGYVKNGEFTLTNGTNATEKKSLEFELEIKTDYSKNGAVTLKADGRDFGTIECEIAKVTPAYTVEVAKVTPIKKGESLATADIVIKEAKAGMFDTDEFIVVNLRNQYTTNVDFGSNYKIETTNGLKVEDEFTKNSSAKKNDLSSIGIDIKSTSTKEAGTITISNLVVNVDGGAVDGDKMIDTYVIDEVKTIKEAVSKSADDAKTPDYSVAYVNVVKEYGVTATKTVFVIGSKAYTVNGEAMTANEAPFVAGKGYTMLPVRALAESLGLKADWNSNTKTATFTNDSKVASVVIGADTMYVNGTPLKLNAKAVIKNGSTFIELRSLASAFGVELQWDAATKTVTIIG